MTMSPLTYCARSIRVVTGNAAPRARWAPSLWTTRRETNAIVSGDHVRPSIGTASTKSAAFTMWIGDSFTSPVNSNRSPVALLVRRTASRTSSRVLSGIDPRSTW
jgi:hypothetical protein